MIVIFVVVIPVVSAFNGAYHPTGLATLGFVAACGAVGFATQLYPAWLARNLPRSEERISFSVAMVQSLDRFGRKFLIFGLVTSIVFVAGAGLMLVFPPVGEKADWIGMIT